MNVNLKQNMFKKILLKELIRSAVADCACDIR